MASTEPIDARGQAAPNTSTSSTTTAGDSVEAGDIDPAATQSADETGQAGDPTDPAKNKAHPWNG